jgi:hypothetical protein
MLEKAMMRETFFAVARPKRRPVSVATEFMEDWEEGEATPSDLEDGENSPRLSLNSVSARTVSPPPLMVTPSNMAHSLVVSGV